MDRVILGKGTACNRFVTMVLWRLGCQLPMALVVLLVIGVAVLASSNMCGANELGGTIHGCPQLTGATESMAGGGGPQVVLCAAQTNGSLTRPATKAQTRELVRDDLEESLRLGRRFMLQSQLPAGDFRYHVDFVTGEVAPEQGAVRQAGALWGLALIHRYDPSDQTRAAVLRGIRFFDRHSALAPSGGRYSVSRHRRW